MGAEEPAEHHPHHHLADHERQQEETPRQAYAFNLLVEEKRDRQSHNRRQAVAQQPDHVVGDGMKKHRIAQQLTVIANPDPALRADPIPGIEGKAEGLNNWPNDENEKHDAGWGQQQNGRQHAIMTGPPARGGL